MTYRRDDGLLGRRLLGDRLRLRGGLLDDLRRRLLSHGESHGGGREGRRRGDEEGKRGSELHGGRGLARWAAGKFEAFCFVQQAIAEVTFAPRENHRR
jgi:hypothetical protein